MYLRLRGYRIEKRMFNANIMQEKKGVCDKLRMKWEGLYMVLHKLSDVVLRIQRSKGAKPRAVHIDRLKPYQGDPIEPWEPTHETQNRDQGITPPIVIHVVPSTEPEVQQPCTNTCDIHDVDKWLSKSPDPRRYPRREHRLPLRYR